MKDKNSTSREEEIENSTGEKETSDNPYMKLQN